MIYFAKTHSDQIESALAHQKSLTSGHYGLNIVWQQLAVDFHNKCYLCEDKARSPRIEHFRPKVISRELEFDWQNLFYSCEHCNAIKSDDYRQLIDCTQCHPDRHIQFDIDALAPIGKRVKVTPLQNNPIYNQSADLLNAIYSGTTACKQLGAQAIVDALLTELNDFRDLVTTFLENQNEQDLADLRWELNNQSPFTAFKRWIVKNNPSYQAELAQYFID